jgi:hypothetical protein
MLSFARFVVFEHKDCPYKLNELPILSAERGQLGPISKLNELKAWELIDWLCRRAENNYPTSLEDDINLLNQDANEGSKMGLNEKNCLQYRISEKVVLRHIRNCKRRVEKLVPMNQL